MEKCTWHNTDNWAFYEGVGPTTMLQHARDKGLDKCADMEVLRSELLDRDANPFGQWRGGESLNILEVGGCLGRVVDWITKFYPQADLEVLEIVDSFYVHLKERFKDHSHITVIKKGLLQSTPSSQYDLTLWMWGGILEMAPEEKLESLKVLSDGAKPKGFVVIDIPHVIVAEPFHQPLDECFGEVHQPEGILRYHLITEPTLVDYAQRFRLNHFQTISYETSTAVPRSLVVLQRK